METKTNFFFHAPKELTTNAFLVWLIYYLDTTGNIVEKQMFFDNLILKKEDCGRSVDIVDLKRQENHVDVLLMFRFCDNGEEQAVLIVDKTWSIPQSWELAKYKELYPNCYRYLYYKLSFVNSLEVKNISRQHYDLITAGMMSSTIEKMMGGLPSSFLHPLIKMYYDYISYTFHDAINKLHESIFVKHQYEVLMNDNGQNYFCDVIAENIAEYWAPYLEENDIEKLLMAIPKITNQIVQMFNELNKTR